MTQICNDVNIIKEALTRPKELTNILDEALNAKDRVTKYFAMKLIVLVAGKKGFEYGKIMVLIPLIKVIE